MIEEEKRKMNVEVIPARRPGPDFKRKIGTTHPPLNIYFRPRNLPINWLKCETEVFVAQISGNLNPAKRAAEYSGLEP
jgi:hypothetical protein